MPPIKLTAAAEKRLTNFMISISLFEKLFCQSLITIIKVINMPGHLGNSNKLRNTLIIHFSLKGSSQHQVGVVWFEIKMGKISRKLVKYEVLPNPDVISVCLHDTQRSTLKFIFKLRKIEEKNEVGGISINQS